MSRTLFTVGHSNHELEFFIDLVTTMRIDVIIDVRSNPTSAYVPHFNKPAISAELKENGIKYLHFGEEFGARRDSPQLMKMNGKVDFEKVRAEPKFQEGVNRVIEGIDKGLRISLMCSEAEPFDCHRFVMISYHFSKLGIDVQHILKDKSLVTSEELEQRLLKQYAKVLPQPDLFNPNVLSKEELVELAYRLREQEVAYTNEI